MKLADRLRKLAERAESIMEACEQITEALSEWDDTEGMTASERAEHRQDIEHRMDEQVAELMAEAAKVQALHPLYVSAEDP